VVQIHVPPLRARGNDILLLASHFVRKFAERSGKKVTGISATAARKLLDYDWPGNVRQLENCIERAITLTRFEELVPEDLPERIHRYESARFGPGEEDTSYVTLDELERRYIKHALGSTKGNKTQAAKLLGVDRRTLYRKLDRYDQTGNVRSPQRERGL
jgi:two-component system response regulator HydG